MLAVEQQQSADAELDSHGDPHAAQAERGDEKHRETEADDPDAAKVQKAWHKRIACSAEGSGGNDGSAEKRLGEPFDAVTITFGGVPRRQTSEPAGQESEC